MLSIKQHRFEYDSTAEVAARRLAEALKKTEWTSMVGKVTPEKVKLYKRLPAWFHNSFNPIFVGRFESSAGGTVLVGRFRASWFVFGFLVVFFGMIGYNLIDAYLQPDHRPGYVEGWRDREIAWHWQFLGFTLLVPLVGWLFGIPSQNAIIRAIKESI